MWLEIRNVYSPVNYATRVFLFLASMVPTEVSPIRIKEFVVSRIVAARRYRFVTFVAIATVSEVVEKV